MGKLKSAKQEAFCRYWAEGATISAAYERAGFAGSRSNASRLGKMIHIVERREEIRAELKAGRKDTEAKPVSSMSGLDLMNKAAELAIEANNAAALAQVGKTISEYDDSIKSLQTDLTKLDDAGLASHCLPFTKALLQGLYPDQPLPPDNRIVEVFARCSGAEEFATAPGPKPTIHTVMPGYGA